MTVPFRLLTPVIAAVCLAAGCATTYRVRTNGYLDHGAVSIPAGTTFAVLTNPSAPNPIFDEDVRMKIERRLAAQGYKIVPSEEAAYFLIYQYDISSRTETETYPDFRTGPAVAQRVYVSGSNKTYTIVSPSFTYATYSSRTRTVHVSRLFLKVLTGDGVRDQKEKAIWVGETVNESGMADLRESIDYLLAASFKYFGQDTGRSREVLLKPEDVAQPAAAPVSKAPKTS